MTDYSQRSDIDFLVITSGELSKETYAAVKKMHERIAASDLKWATNVEDRTFAIRASAA
jgi:hypothetical protein